MMDPKPKKATTPLEYSTELLKELSGERRTPSDDAAGYVGRSTFIGIAIRPRTKKDSDHGSLHSFFDVCLPSKASYLRLKSIFCLL